MARARLPDLHRERGRAVRRDRLLVPRRAARPRAHQDAPRGREGGEHGDLVRSGVALTYEEPEILWAPSGVYSFSFRNPIHKVASSFTELLEGWLASGCFSSHDFDAAWEKTRAFVPAGSVSPDKNPWVVAYRAFHDEDG